MEEVGLRQFKGWFAGVLNESLAQLLERERLQNGCPGDLAARLREIGAHCSGLPDIDTRAPDEIAGYDETGLWRYLPVATQPPGGSIKAIPR